MAREPVALVIADHRMPGMTGAAFLAETVERYPAVIRIVLTGYPEVEVLVDAINRGHVYHFLTKPWQPHELRQVVRRGLDSWEAARRARAPAGRDPRRLRARPARGGAAGPAADPGRARARHAGAHPGQRARAAARRARSPAAAAPWLDMAERAAEWLARRRGAVAHRRLRRRARAGGAAATGRAARRWSTPRSAATAAAASDRRLALRGERDERRRGRSIRTGSRWRCRPAHQRRALHARRRRRRRGAAARRRVDARSPCATPASASPPSSSPTCSSRSPRRAAICCCTARGATTFGARGLGLGLATVRAIAEAHGGRVDGRERPGRGQLLPPPAAARVCGVRRGGDARRTRRTAGRHVPASSPRSRCAATTAAGRCAATQHTRTAYRVDYYALHSGHGEVCAAGRRRPAHAATPTSGCSTASTSSPAPTAIRCRAVQAERERRFHPERERRRGGRSMSDAASRRGVSPASTPSRSSAASRRPSSSASRDRRGDLRGGAARRGVGARDRAAAAT